jgi:hypothetical protein
MVYIGGRIDQTLHYINMQRNNTLGPYHQASTAQAKPTVGNEPNLQVINESFLLDFFLLHVWPS